MRLRAPVRMSTAKASKYLFPSLKQIRRKPHMTNLLKGWAATLKEAGVPCFTLFEVRHTFVTRLLAGGVADHMVRQMLGDAEVFKGNDPPSISLST